MPRFVTRARSRDIWTCTGDRIPDFLSESSLDAMRRRITHLTPHDLEQQAWIIRVSLLTASEERSSRTK